MIETYAVVDGAGVVQDQGLNLFEASDQLLAGDGHTYSIKRGEDGTFELRGLTAGDYRIPSPYDKPSFFPSRDKINVFAAGATNVRVTFKVPPQEPGNHFSGQAVLYSFWARRNFWAWPGRQ